MRRSRAAAVVMRLAVHFQSMLLKIAVVAGDGIGPEVTDQGLRVLEAVCSSVWARAECYAKRHWRGSAGGERGSVAGRHAGSVYFCGRGVAGGGGWSGI